MKVLLLITELFKCQTRMPHLAHPSPGPPGLALPTRTPCSFHSLFTHSFIYSFTHSVIQHTFWMTMVPGARKIAVYKIIMASAFLAWTV